MGRLLQCGWLYWLCASFCTASLIAAEPASDETDYQARVQPFLSKYCLKCHGDLKQEGQLNLSVFQSAQDIRQQFATWDLVLDRLVAADMPPEDAIAQPTAPERMAVIEWLQHLREQEAQRTAGDPGPVLARRLSHAEFDYTIRDLTGVDIRPTREFPVDPANEAGFDNSGESLTMSPALLKKYLAAVRHVADHLVLLPQGIVFAPHVVVTETDRDKFCVQRIVTFYDQHQVDYADYFESAWILETRHQSALADEHALSTELNVLATERGLSPKYLSLIWETLHRPTPGPLIQELQHRWRRLSDSADPVALRSACEALRDWVVEQRKVCDQPVEKLHLRGNSDGSQPLILWWNRQQATQRLRYVGDGQDTELDAARSEFCAVFPNAFYITSRGLYADPNLGAGLRLLTAGFHLMQGYFRDDMPLYQLVLSEAEQQEIDRLWSDLNFVTGVPLRQYKDFVFFERAEPPQFMGGPEFDFARPENKDVTSPENLRRLSEVYLAKVRKSDPTPDAVQAVEDYFRSMETDIRWIEETHRTAETNHLEALRHFATRAYRRPVTESEWSELQTFYQQLRSTEGLSHEDAMRDCVAMILLSPHFLYRFDQAADGPDIQPLTDYELASRLSYFLWSSMPDQPLLDDAAAGTLHQPERLRQQARRMLQDPRVRALAVEFGGNWLEFRRFEEHNSVDRERFPEFTPELRQAMFEEPIRFLIDLFQSERSVLEALYGQHTFVNPILARHYGMPDNGLLDNGLLRSGNANAGRTAGETSRDQWWRVDNAGPYGRGGLLPMAVFLTNNSPGLRTSPVQRGYWVVRRLLGEHIPPPPPDVPELPKDESQAGELSVPELLARHRSHSSCAGCHVRFDSIGLTFEGFGPVGERRQVDLGQRPVNTAAEFPDGSTGEGLEGLQRYLRESRADDFRDNLHRKLLAYALGRGLLLSDQQTLKLMADESAQHGERFQTLVEVIVTSPQFLNKRGATAAIRESPAQSPVPMP